MKQHFVSMSIIPGSALDGQEKRMLSPDSQGKNIGSVEKLLPRYPESSEGRLWISYKSQSATGIQRCIADV